MSGWVWRPLSTGSWEPGRVSGLPRSKGCCWPELLAPDQALEKPPPPQGGQPALEAWDQDLQAQEARSLDPTSNLLRQGLGLVAAEPGKALDGWKGQAGALLVLPSSWGQTPDSPLCTRGLRITVRALGLFRAT